jgi:3-polyprenyl-4-hydroxybenzoate decarboxylase
VIVVAEDVDPFSLGQVFWAMGSRTQGGRDIEVWKYCKTSRSDPSVLKSQGEFTDRLIIDATKKLDYPYQPLYGGHWAPVAVPPRKILELVDLKWGKEQGRPVAERDIRSKSQEIYEVEEQKWQAWREKYCVLSKERQQEEIALSYPRLEKDIFE